MQAKIVQCRMRKVEPADLGMGVYHLSPSRYDTAPKARGRAPSIALSGLTTIENRSALLGTSIISSGGGMGARSATERLGPLETGQTEWDKW